MLNIVKLVVTVVETLEHIYSKVIVIKQKLHMSPQSQFVATQNVRIGFIPPRGDLSMLFNEFEKQYKYKNIVDNMQDEPGHTTCCKQKKGFWILLRMNLQRVLEKLHVR
ncbi:hypothetical protein NQ317_005138 [Molorchus minor]|uniref:Uncharacterized protein n=1 Tax=Molorchus minor TaxID=1323400 RepID=A0ABQ9IRD9_9CUCU|nr:hypothetical protein NQ317_005138 [Molorchus minor]